MQRSSGLAVCLGDVCSQVIWFLFESIPEFLITLWLSWGILPENLGICERGVVSKGEDMPGSGTLVQAKQGYPVSQTLSLAPIVPLK